MYALAITPETLASCSQLHDPRARRSPPVSCHHGLFTPRGQSVPPLALYPKISIRYPVYLLFIDPTPPRIFPTPP
eukprot:753790-Hanusia_phi.AAC.10